MAHFLSSSSFDLVFLQEIPPGDSGQYRLRQLVRAMNAGSPLNEPRFSYLLGQGTVVLDTTSQLNTIIYRTIRRSSITPASPLSYTHVWWPGSSQRGVMNLHHHQQPSLPPLSTALPQLDLPLRLLPHRSPEFPQPPASSPPQPASPRFRTVSTSSYQRLWRQPRTGRSPCPRHLTRGISLLGGSSEVI